MAGTRAHKVLINPTIADMLLKENMDNDLEYPEQILKSFLLFMIKGTENENEFSFRELVKDVLEKFKRKMIL